MTRARFARAALLLAIQLCCGCSFFGKVQPLTPHYYDPEIPITGGEASPPAAGRPSLRLGPVTGGSHLRERIAYRVSEREYGFYDERRWTERPENYLRRALARSLFEERAIASLVTGVGPLLEVELTDFSELLTPKHAVRVRARAVLVEQRTVRFEHTFTVEEPVAPGAEDFSSVADAMAVALQHIVNEIADRVFRELSPATGEAATPTAP